MIASLTNINKYYNGNHVLKNVNLTIENNDKIGLAGINGCGKSTLIRILMGKEIPDNFNGSSGTVSIFGGASIGYLEQAGGLENNNTVIGEMKNVFKKLLDIYDRMRELETQISSSNIIEEASNASKNNNLTEEYAKLSSYFESNDGYLIDIKIKMILNGMGFEEDTLNRSISSFSGGEKTRLAIAKLLLEEPDLLILDEPTNHLDFKTVQWLEDYLKTYKGALLIVSHDRYFLDALCLSICEIENGCLTRYKGNYTSFIALKDAAIQRKMKEYESQQKEIAKMQDYIDRNLARASTAKSAQSRVKALEKMEIIDKPMTYVKSSKIRFEFDINPPLDLLSVNGLDIAVGEGDAQKILAENVSFEIKRGDKVAVIGDNGTGKSTLLKELIGNTPRIKGSVRWTSNVKISYFEQENTILNPENTVFDEMHNKYPSLTDFEIRSILGQVRLSGENVFKKIGVISGGERAKVRFAVMMLEKGNVLVLDEPTNHLDLSTKEVLEDALMNYCGTIIFISHDRYLLSKLADRIIEIDDNKVNAYNGGFSFYLESKKNEQAIQREIKDEQAQLKIVQSEKEKKVKQYKNREQRNLEAQRRNRIRLLEKEIDELQQRLDILQDEITQPNIYENFKLMHEKCEEISSIKALMDEKFDELVELE